MNVSMVWSVLDMSSYGEKNRLQRIARVSSSSPFRNFSSSQKETLPPCCRRWRVEFMGLMFGCHYEECTPREMRFLVKTLWYACKILIHQLLLYYNHPMVINHNRSSESLVLWVTFRKWQCILSGTMTSLSLTHFTPLWICIHSL